MNITVVHEESADNSESICSFVSVQQFDTFHLILRSLGIMLIFVDLL